MKDFSISTESLSRGKKGKRKYLNDSETDDLMRQLNEEPVHWCDKCRRTLPCIKEPMPCSIEIFQNN